jgi:hypothetical protein
MGNVKRLVPWMWFGAATVTLLVYAAYVVVAGVAVGWSPGYAIGWCVGASLHGWSSGIGRMVVNGLVARDKRHES